MRRAGTSGTRAGRPAGGCDGPGGCFHFIAAFGRIAQRSDLRAHARRKKTNVRPSSGDVCA